MEKPIVNASAACLSKTSWFAGGENGPYSLYAHVPAKLVRCAGSPDMSADDVQKSGDNNVIDLLICNGRDRNVVLAVLLDREDWLDDAPGDYHLNGIRHLFFETEPAPEPKTAEALYSQLKIRISEELDADMAGWLDYDEGSTVDFALQGAVSVGKVLSECPELPQNEFSPTARLSETHMLSAHGTPTPYGSDCGLFYRYNADGDGRLMVAFSEVERFKHRLLWGLTPRDGANSREPLKRRLERLERLQPSDDVYGAQLVSLLEQLLETRLEDFCVEREPIEQLARVEYFLGNISSANTELLPENYTYRDALSAIHTLRRKYETASFKSKSDAWYFSCLEALRCLGAQIFMYPSQAQIPGDKRRQPLETRLRKLHMSTDGRFPIASQSVPLAHYFYAAAQMAGTDYQNWLYSTRILPKIDLKKHREDMLSLILAVYHAVAERHSDSLLYDLLVEPIFPDPDLIFNTNFYFNGGYTK